MTKKHPKCKGIPQYKSILAVFNVNSAINFGGKIGKYRKKYNRKHHKFM